MATDWSPAQYLKFADERTRPARVLLARVPLSAPERVVDLGCGPGNSTALLVERFPEAEMLGIDTSPAMLAEAQKSVPGARFLQADAATWTPDAPVDLVFANAVLQWVPDHLAVLQRLAGALRPGGVLAVQMPDNLAEPTHVIMREVAASGPWAEKLAGAARLPLPGAAVYHEALSPRFRQVELWRTTYYHLLPDAAGVVDWMRGTGLRPFLEPLNESERQDVLRRYTTEIAKAYPPLLDGRVMLPFPRLFLLGVR